MSKSNTFSTTTAPQKLCPTYITSDCKVLSHPATFSDWVCLVQKPAQECVAGDARCIVHCFNALHIQRRLETSVGASVRTSLARACVLWLQEPAFTETHSVCNYKCHARATSVPVKHTTAARSLAVPNRGVIQIGLRVLRKFDPACYQRSSNPRI